MAPDAADGQEPRPPSLDRRRNAAGSQEHAAASRVKSSALPTHRTAARRVTALRVRYGGIAVSRSEPAGSELHAPRDDTAQSGWMTRQASMLFGTLAPASEARRVKMIIRTTPRSSARGPVSKGASSVRSYKWIRRREAGPTYRIGPAGLSADRAHIILAAPDPHPASCGLRLGGECRDRHGGAWRTSLPHCTWSPRGPWPDRK